MSRRTSPGRPGPAPVDTERESTPARSATPDPSGWSLPGVDEQDLDFDAGELREFLAGDLLESGADPVFKERLREKLWRLVRSRYGTPRVDDDEAR